MENLNGLIIIDKEPGFTSHDVVSCVRRILSFRKVGHTGTLDPDATGVLPICIGKGTRVSDMLMMSDKEYIARVRLGKVTDTQDISGAVLEQCDASHISASDIENAIAHFIGDIEQIPPMYSAIKIDGQKMYDLARQGIEVERKPRKITVYSIDLSDVRDGGFTIRVRCSKGTYIRTLCHDIGQYLGCGACMETLRRTQSSVFSIEDAITLSQLEQAVGEGRLDEVLLPADTVFTHYEAVTVDDEIKIRLRNGAPSTVPHPLGTYRVYDESGEFIAIGDVKKINGRNKIVVVKYFGQ